MTSNSPADARTRPPALTDEPPCLSFSTPGYDVAIRWVEAAFDLSFLSPPANAGHGSSLSVEPPSDFWMWPSLGDRGEGQGMQVVEQLNREINSIVHRAEPNE